MKKPPTQIAAEAYHATLQATSNHLERAQEFLTDARSALAEARLTSDTNAQASILGLCVEAVKEKAAEAEFRLCGLRHAIQRDLERLSQ